MRRVLLSTELLWAISVLAVLAPFIALSAASDLAYGNGIEAVFVCVALWGASALAGVVLAMVGIRRVTAAWAGLAISGISLLAFVTLIGWLAYVVMFREQ